MTMDMEDLDNTNEEDEGEEDLYSDLPTFKYGDAMEKLQNNNTELQNRVINLEELVEKQTKELEGYQSKCMQLEKNISALMKTAQTEIKRKDKKITELNLSVIKLNTEVMLFTRKRKRDRERRDSNIKDDEPHTNVKRQKNSEDNVSVDFVSNANPSLCEKILKREEPKKAPVICLEKKLVTPGIKCHTLYSQRMYNKIYNANKKIVPPLPDSNLDKQTEETNSLITEKTNEIEENAELKDKCFSMPISSSTINECCNNNELEPEGIKLRDKNLSSTVVNFEINLDKMNNCNKNVISDEKHLQPSESNFISEVPKQVNEICTEINVKNTDQITPLSQNIPLNGTTNSDVLKKVAKPLVISRTNISFHFSSRHNNKKPSQVNKIKNASTIVDKTKKSGKSNATILDKVNSVSRKDQVIAKTNITKVQKKVKEQLNGISLIKKAKKPVANIIPPIPDQMVKSCKKVSNEIKESDSCEEKSSSSELKDEKSDIIEALFGSPLKWSENSVDDVKQVSKLSLPGTAFEDSCSAHIENIKFKKIENGDPSKSQLTELSLSKKFSYVERKCYFQSSESSVDKLPFFSNKDAVEAPCKDILLHSSGMNWPFQKSRSDIPSKNCMTASPTFSSFVNVETTSEACDVPLSVKIDSSALHETPVKFFKTSKYNDSVLGQFDDTTQLINALAKETSKLSPIRTPIKETKSDIASSSTAYKLDGACSIPQIQSADKELTYSISSLPSAGKELLVVSNVNIAPEAPLPDSSPVLTNPKDTEKVTSSIAKISPNGKKLAIPAAVISSVEKKLSFPTSFISSVTKKPQKKTILLEQPINILSPRKTPRQIGKNKVAITPKNKNLTLSKADDHSKNKHVSDIKSLPSPENKKGSFTEIVPTSVNNIPDLNGISNKVCRADNSNRSIASSEEKNKYSISSNDEIHKSGKDFITKRNKINSNNDSILRSKVATSRPLLNQEQTTIKEKNNHSSSRTENVHKKEYRSPSRKENSPLSNDSVLRSKMATSRNLSNQDQTAIKEKNHHSSSRAENVHRKEYKSPSRKENSPLKKDSRYRYTYPDIKPALFKKPEVRRESFRRPNCRFRQSSVERKFSKDWKYSSKSRPYSEGHKGKYSERGKTAAVHAREYKYGFENKFETNQRHIMTPTKKNPVISRSSTISWPANARLVSTNMSHNQSNSNFSRTPSQIKWILRPIDFGKGSNSPRSETTKGNISEGSSKPSSTPMASKPTPPRDQVIFSPERYSPAKPVVIIAEKRPIKFGSRNKS